MFTNSQYMYKYFVFMNEQPLIAQTLLIRGKKKNTPKSHY